MNKVMWKTMKKGHLFKDGGLSVHASTFPKSHEQNSINGLK